MKKIITLLLLIGGFACAASADGGEGRRIYVKVIANWNDAWLQGGICLHVWGANSEGDLTGGWANCTMTRIGSTDWAYIQTNELPASVNFIVYCKNADNWRIEKDNIDLRNKYIELTNSGTATIKDLSYSVIDATDQVILGNMTTTDNLTYTYDVDATASNIEVLIAPSFVSEFGFSEYLWHQCFRPYGNESSAGFGFENKTGQHFGIWNNSTDSWHLNAKAKYTFTFEPNKLSDMTISPYIERTLNPAAEGYATFSSAYNVIPGEGLTAKYASAVDASGSITWTEYPSTGIAANQGALLIGTAGSTYKFTPATDASAPSTNFLMPISEKTQLSQDGENGKTNYILTKVGSGPLAFYKVNANGSWCAAGTAYLSTTAPNPARGYFSLEDEDATAIEGIANENNINLPVYDLQGRRVTSPQKGLYIVNGKKVVIK